MTYDLEQFRRAADHLHADKKLTTALCKIEAEIASFEMKAGPARSERDAYEYVIGDATLHPFWFHAWQRVRRAAEAA